MLYVRFCTVVIAIVIGSLTVGCAPAYHSYAGCTIDCQYCVPPPLAYTHYAGCVCHSCAASKHLNQPLLAPSEIEDSRSPEK
jgi:hypothetical protein